jgi:hypothetical protein
MFKLISKTSVLPRSLFVNDINILETIGIGGFGRVLKGEHENKQVALKVLYQVQVSALPIMSLTTLIRMVGCATNRLLPRSFSLAIAHT